VSATAEVTSAEVAKEVAAKVESEAVKGKGKGKKAAAAAAAAPAPAPAPVPKAKSGPPEAGESVELEGFGGEVETNDGEKTTLSKLVEESKAGVVLFT